MALWYVVASQPKWQDLAQYKCLPFLQQQGSLDKILAQSTKYKVTYEKNTLILELEKIMKTLRNTVHVLFL